MRTIEQVQAEIENLELNISELKADIDGFEYSSTEAEFDDFLDECYDEVNICGMTYSASNALKSCDPVAYRCAKSDYEGNFDLDDCTEYTNMTEELESLESDLVILKDEFDSLESEYEYLTSFDAVAEMLEANEIQFLENGEGVI